MSSHPTVDATCAAVVIAARTGGYGEAAAALARLMAEIGELARAGEIPSVGLESLTESLRTLAMLQSWADWVAIADVVEHELAPRLRSA